ncbi:hypothetical protein C1645_739284 [Glomus cerebriforme]|uniref:Uncharacterized protein n=1 Tax=Glomus cerebriforme TaxID=658196 RepID=A0A397SRD9_9GLOM|nr:hypothetical protein C1645_739284 [Glomus cerebriforme]
MAKKFHISTWHVYEIWNNNVRLQQGLILFSSDQLTLDKMEQTLKVILEVSSIFLLVIKISKKNGQKKKVKIDEKLVNEAINMVEKNNKNDVVFSSDNSSDTSWKDRTESFLKNLVNHDEKLKDLIANTTSLI